MGTWYLLIAIPNVWSNSNFAFNDVWAEFQLIIRNSLVSSVALNSLGLPLPALAGCRHKSSLSVMVWVGEMCRGGHIQWEALKVRQEVSHRLHLSRSSFFAATTDNWKPTEIHQYRQGSPTAYGATHLMDEKLNANAPASAFWEKACEVCPGVLWWWRGTSGEGIGCI